MNSIAKNQIKSVLGKLGYSVRKVKFDKAEGFPDYYEHAQKSGIDVNDWEEKYLGWEAALPVLEKTVFRFLQSDSVVCELGIGTGRYSRHIQERIPQGKLHLVDHSPWIVSFARDYFKSAGNVRCHLNDGYSLPLSPDDSLDLVFSTGTFIALKLGFFYLYARNFFSLLKPNGYCILDYLDVNTREGWRHLEDNSFEAADCYTYHATETIDRVFVEAGFQIIERVQCGKSTYLIAGKSSAG